MSITEQVFNLLDEHGPSTAPELLALMEGVTRAQVETALQNGARCDKLAIVGVRRREGCGRSPSVYALIEQTNPERCGPRYPSVWAYAAGVTA